MNNIGPVSGDSLFKAFVNPTNKSVPPAPVNPKAGDSSGAVHKGNDSNPDEFLKTTLLANAGFMSKPGQLNDWGEFGAKAVPKETTESGLSNPLNATSDVFLVPLTTKEQRQEVQTALTGVIKEKNPNDAQRISSLF